MDAYDYDVAIIGCGAYGMHLAAHAKRKGKIAIHLHKKVEDINIQEIILFKPTKNENGVS